MTPAARTVALVVGVVGIVMALAAVIRDVVLASDESVSWQLAAPLRRLTTQPSWATSVAAAAAAALAVALISLAIRQFRAADGGPALIQFQDQAGWARLDVRAMERGMAKRLQAALPGTRVQDVQLSKAGDSWSVVVAADVPATDLRAARARMHEVLGADLLRTGGMRLDRLDLIVDRLGPPA